MQGLRCLANQGFSRQGLRTPVLQARLPAENLTFVDLGFWDVWGKRVGRAGSIRATASSIIPI